MLALQQAYEVRESIKAYLKATFPFKDRSTSEAFDRFITNEKDGLFKGPYLSVGLPFLSHDGSPLPLEIQPGFNPYTHQVRAFQRLFSAEGHSPGPTLITTGTGSGKTEAFLYPILDHCYKHRDQKGIKCIILYPMNALASDQAARIARTIFEDPKLKGQLTVGLFIGIGKDSNKYPTTMDKDHIIENRNTILDSPPDILLTNFKMLDYALMRGQFHSIWKHNDNVPELLRFLVLDEIHTYDGAQGSDVANLIRRLKLKLNIPDGVLCPIGTSATMGAGESSDNLLLEYASTVFGETFGQDSIIREERQSLPEFFGKEEDEIPNRFPSTYKLREAAFEPNESFDHFITRQYDLWQINPLIGPQALGEELKNLRIVWDLLEIAGSKVTSITDLLILLSRKNPEFRKIPEWNAANQYSPKEAVVNSILALISEARSPISNRPLLNIRVQLWIRELTGVLRELNTEPVFTWRSKKPVGSDRKSLPAYFCRECGASGWLGVKMDNRQHFERDTNDVYRKFFQNHKNLYFINTHSEEHRGIDEYSPTTTHDDWISESLLTLHDNAKDGRIRIYAYRKHRNEYSDHFCPECNTQNSISIIGTRVSTLASVGTSQLLSTDLSTQAEQDRKLLLFTNAVQDAAHEAGYIQSRNYRFLFRTALQRVINSLGRPVNLEDLQQEFLKFWKIHADEQGKRPMEAFYHKLFPSDKLGEFSVSAQKKGAENFDRAFAKEFDLRITWEIASEYGYNAILGRTLEKTGASAVHLDDDKLEPVYRQLEDWLSAQGYPLKREQLVSFLHGLIYRIRVRGGISHPYLNKFRSGDLKLWDLNWNKDGRHFLNRKFGPKSRFPRLIVSEPVRSNVVDTTNTTGLNWYHAYYRKSLPLSSSHPDAINEFYTHLLRALEQAQIVDKVESKDVPTYAIVPSALLVSTQVRQLKCSHCESTLATTHIGAQHMIGAKCMNYRCTGEYSIQDAQNTARNYYNLVYNRERATRIYSRDHTGLLERKTREILEADFKRRPEFDSVNTLVATSTLEMGIDIGELTSAMNTSIPPLPSNYLQRIGRAGRSSGGSCIINLAQNEQHDLYYFESPEEMMEGLVHPPGCFLEARDILRRHFVAYCIDSWTSEDPDLHRIPTLFRLMSLASFDPESPAHFYNKLIEFMRNRAKPLVDKFETRYANRVSPQVFDELRKSLFTEELYDSLRNVFREVKAEYDQVRKTKAEIKKAIEERELAAQDEERIALEQEMRSLNGMRVSIEKRNVLEHLTNKGILPNYAFPETGVVLHAQIYQSHASASREFFKGKEFEIVRPAAQAIRELMPDNYFYTQGYKLQISGLNVLNWQEESGRLRFCSHCDHLAPAVGNPELLCPKCGNASWGADSNTHRFVRLLRTKSFNERASATVDDTSEERTAHFAHSSRHFHFHRNSVKGSLALKDIPFGIEFVKEVDITDVNAGDISAHTQLHRTININGKEEIPVSGFITCRVCGRSSSSLHKGDSNRTREPADYHYPYCRHRHTGYNNVTDDIFEEVYLYRSVKTEALKVLCPVQQFHSESNLEIFKAGLELGLGKYYKGNPDHIRIVPYSEFNFRTQRFDCYLVMYDNIPGGTGYLSKLFDPAEFSVVLKNAYESLRDCTCQHEGKDGCYKCILNYANQYRRDELSRQKAEELFSKIVAATSQWEKSHQSLNSITQDGLVEESELESLFIDLLRRYVRREENLDAGWEFSENKFEGIVQYQLTIPSGSINYAYQIIPQYSMGPNQGVSLSTRADFLFRCIYASQDSQPIDVSGIPAIAVFLDGHQFHASKENNRFILDVERRKAVSASGAYRTWTLTWKDIERFRKDATDVELDYFTETLKASSEQIQSARKHPFIQNIDRSYFVSPSNMDRFLWQLRHPDEAWLAYLAPLQERFCGVSIDTSFLKDRSNLARPIAELPILQTSNASMFLDKIRLTGVFDSRLFQQLNTLTLRGYLHYTEAESYPYEDWEKFWHLYNLIQSCPEVLIGPRTVPEEKESTDAFQEILKYYTPEYHPIVEALLMADIQFETEGSYSFVDKHDNVIAECVIGLPDLGIAIGVTDAESVSALTALNFRIINPEHFDISQIKAQ